MFLHFFFSSFLCWPLWKKIIMCAPSGSCALLLERQGVYMSFRVLLLGRAAHSPYLFTQSFISVNMYIRVCVFYTLGDVPILFYLLFCSDCSCFAHWQLTQSAPVSL
jgi:hypothetical protein